MKLNRETPSLVAVTGGIGSGKSEVLSAIADCGYTVISCDRVAADAYRKYFFKRKIKKAFPSAVKGFIFTKIDKKQIAESAFFDDEEYNRLLKEVTLPVYEETLKIAKKQKGTVFVEVPLLFECEKQGDFDRVIVVLRDKNVRAESVEKRSGLKKSEIAARMARQIDYDNTDFSMYRVLINDGNLEKLKVSAAKLAAVTEKELEAKKHEI